MPAQADHTHVDDIDATYADSTDFGDGTPTTAPDELPAATLAEPVALGGLTILTGGIAALVASGVPWYGALAFVALVVVVTACQRGSVMPTR